MGQCFGQLKFSNREVLGLLNQPLIHDIHDYEGSDLFLTIRFCRRYEGGSTCGEAASTLSIAEESRRKAVAITLQVR